MKILPLEHALIIIPAIAAKNSPMAGFMKGAIEQQVRDWYAKGVAVCVDPNTPLGKDLASKGYLK